MRTPIPLAFLTIFLVATACERAPSPASPTPTPTPTSTPTSGDPIGAASPAPAPAAPPAPPPLPGTAILRGAFAVETSARLPLAPGAEVVVDPTARFEVELGARAPDARLVLVDGRDDLVAASATRELAEGTRLVLSPAAPLTPGSRYALRVDGALDRELHDEAGRAYAPVTLPILAAGTPPPPEPKKPGRKKHRR